MKRRQRIGLYLCWVSLQLRTFKEEIQAAEWLPWVLLDRLGLSTPCHSDRTVDIAGGPLGVMNWVDALKKTVAIDDARVAICESIVGLVGS
jgi:hypothetical protein